MTSSEAATLYIGGQWIPTASGASFEVLNPADESVLGYASNGTPADAASAIDSAAGAFADWAGLSAYARAASLDKAYRWMLERAEDLAQLMPREQGKPIRAARNEVKYAADFLS